ncbi:MAG: hypothetical protein RR656_00265 [Cetobacterium sp.]
MFLPILKDNEFKFLIEEEIEDQYNLENCREDILSMVDSDEDEEMYEEFYFDEEETEE